MENKKQTAVEWLIKNFMLNGLIRLTKEQHSLYKELTDLAKQMEKEQIIKSNRDGVDMVVNKQKFVTGEEYYKETYGNYKTNGSRMAN